MTETLRHLADFAAEKANFTTVANYTNFCRRLADYRHDVGFQAEIVAQNKNQYRFFQFKQDGNHQISRPVNDELFIHYDHVDDDLALFNEAFHVIEQGEEVTAEHRRVIQHGIYTCQQSIGIALDALPGPRQQSARKVNGDLFERFIRLLIRSLGIEVDHGFVRVEVPGRNIGEEFEVNYEHDLIIKNPEAVNEMADVAAIGSVKTTSKDRVDKIFMDKFLYSRLTNTEIPHFAIFLHDVQRANSSRKAATSSVPRFKVNQTFLTGKFKMYTLALNPLDGVYYCDPLSVMETDSLLSEQIGTIDKFFADDLAVMLQGLDPDEVSASSIPSIGDASGGVVDVHRSPGPIAVEIEGTSKKLKAAKSK